MPPIFRTLELTMNRIVLYGLSCFFALIGIGLIGGPKEAQAFHGWQFYGCCGCQGWHPWHGNQRCYSGNGCYGCSRCCGCSGSGHCCASSCCGGHSCYQRCYGCYGGCGCQGAVSYSCQGCYGGCAGCGGYYQAVVPTIIVPVEPTPAVSSPANSSSGTTTLQAVLATDSEFRSFTDASVISFGSYSADVTAPDLYIHEPR